METSLDQNSTCFLEMELYTVIQLLAISSDFPHTCGLFGLVSLFVKGWRGLLVGGFGGLIPLWVSFMGVGSGRIFFGGSRCRKVESYKIITRLVRLG